MNKYKKIKSVIHGIGKEEKGKCPPGERTTVGQRAGSSVGRHLVQKEPLP